jgi:hypothetical protein
LHRQLVVVKRSMSPETACALFPCAACLLLHKQNMRKGEFSRPKASGKRAIELGAGMGLAGLAFALIGGQ